MAGTTVGTLNVILAAKTAAFKRGMMAATQHLQSVKFAAVAVGSAITGTIGIAAKMAASFDKEMMRVAAVSNATTAQYKQMERAALGLAATSKFTAQEVAEGMGFLAMAGMEANQVIRAMPKALELAAAGMIDLGTASDIVTNMMAGMGLQFEELARANDTVVSAITGANVDVRMLGESFRYVGPVAKAAGVSFEEITASLALLGNAGIQGSMAGTTMRGAITRLLNPSKEASRILEEFGVRIFDASGNMRKFDAIVRDVEFSGLADGARGASRMMEIFGLRAGPGMQALVDVGSAALSKFTKRLEESAGVAKRISSMQMRTLDGRIKVLQSSFASLAIDLGQRFKPVLKKVADSLTNVINGINELPDSIKNTVLRLAALTAAISGVAAGLAAVAKLGPVLMSIGSKFFAKFFLPIAAAAGAVALLVTAIGALSNAISVVNWGELFAGVKNELKALKFDMLNLWADILDGAVSVWKSINRVARTYLDKMSKTIDFYREKFFLMVSFVTGKTSEEAGGIAREAAKGGGVGDDAIRVAGRVAAAAGRLAREVIADLRVSASDTSDAIAGITDDIAWSANALKDGVVSGANFLGSSLSEGVRLLSAVLQKIPGFGFISGMLSDIRKQDEILGDGAKKTKKATEDLIKVSKKNQASLDAFVNATEYASATFGEKVAGRVRSVLNNIAEAVQKQAESIRDTVISGLGEFGSLVKTAQEGFKSGGVWGAVIAVLVELLMKTESFALIVSSLNMSIGSLVSVLDVLLRPIARLFPTLAVFTEMVSRLVSMFLMTAGLFGLFDGAIERLMDGLYNVIVSIAKAFNRLIRGVRDIVKKIPGIGGKLRDALNELLINVDELFQQAYTGELPTNQLGELATAAEEAAEALLNVPSGYRVALARFEATEPQLGPVDAGVMEPAQEVNIEVTNEGSTVIVNGITDPDEVAARVAEILEDENLRNNGTILDAASPYLATVNP